MPKSLYILMVKNPDYTSVKSRIGAETGAIVAQDIYKALLNALSQRFKGTDYDLCLAYTPRPDGLEQLFGNVRLMEQQTHGGIGERMASLFEKAFDDGYEHVVLTGSDIPDLNENHVLSAFENLEKSGCAIGPSVDGGYYLIGFTKKTYFCDFFHGITYSNADVFDKTIEKLKRKKISPAITDMLNDLDTLGDLLQYVANSDSKLSRELESLIEKKSIAI